MNYYLKKNSKKGAIMHESYFMLFEIILVFIVFLSLLSFINESTSSTYFERNFYARDIALTIDALYACPETIVYNYKAGLGLNNYTIEILSGLVKVASTGSHLYSSFYYAPDTLLGFKKKTLVNPPSILFAKTSEALKIDDTSLTLSYTAPVPRISTADNLKSQVIMLEARDELSGKIVSAFYEQFNREFNAVYVENVSSLNNLHTRYSDILLTFYFSKQPAIKNDFSVHYDGSLSSTKLEKAKKLASLIANNIASNPLISKRLSSITVTPLFSPEFEDDRLHLIINLGNINQSQENSLSALSSIAAEAIFKGISDYYKGYTKIVESAEVIPAHTSAPTKFLIKTRLRDKIYVNSVHAVVIDEQGDIKHDVLLLDDGLTGDNEKNDKIFGNACVECLDLSAGKYNVDIYVDMKNGTTALVKRAASFTIGSTKEK